MIKGARRNENVNRARDNTVYIIYEFNNIVINKKEDLSLPVVNAK